MDTKINVDMFLDYSREVILQVLTLVKRVYDDLKEKEDIAGIEKLENEVIPIYETMFLSLNIEEVSKLASENIEKFNKLKNNIEKLAIEYNFSEDFLNKKIEKRKMLKGKSGSEVLERFYKYKLKELKRIKGDFMVKINKLLSEEEKLNFELTNTIQEEEQLPIMEKIIEVSKKYRNLNTILEKYQIELKDTENKLNKKWYYEIYGTTEEKVLLDIYKSGN